MCREARQFAVDLGLRRLRKMRRRGFRLDHPLFDQLLEQFVVAFRVAVDQLLKGAEFAHLALQNDVALNARHDAVHHACGLRRRGNAERLRRARRGPERNENENRQTHQNVVPKLKKNWKAGSRDDRHCRDCRSPLPG